MTKRKVILWALALAGVVGFGFGVVNLLLLRFETGDIYPPYSSLRTDPLGTKVLYDSLDRLGGVRRNFLPLRKLSGRKGTTLLYLGARPKASFHVPLDAEDPIESLAEFVSDGGRLVVSFSPKASLDGVHVGMGALRRRFGFEVDSDDAGPEAMTARPGEAGEAGRPDVSWHSTWYFKGLSPQWRQVYRRDDRPVIIEREFKKGSVVLCTDTYFLSNEAMLKERRPRLLAWLVGGRQIIFDETHLGAIQQAGIATLAREYNLAGLFFVLVLLAGLFVWKNAVTFLPRSRARAERLSGASVAGRGSAAGLFNLLRKSISPRNILPVCLSEWARSAAMNPSEREKARKRIEAAINAQQGRSRGQRDLVAAYRSICRILSERTHKRGIHRRGA